jgi:hypothetical protein
VSSHREGGQLPAARASETAEGASAAAEAGEAATRGGDAAATPLAAPPRGPDQGGDTGGFCIPSCGRVEKKKKKKKKTTPAERGAAKTKTAHADPPLDIERIHHLLGTLHNVAKSADLQEIRIEEHQVV